MATARVYMSGDDQIVEFPEGFRIDADEVEIIREGGGLVLTLVRRTMANRTEQPASAPEAFESDKSQRPFKER